MVFLRKSNLKFNLLPLALLLFLPSFNLKAQLLDSITETVWVNSTDNNHSPQTLDPKEYIGNYKVLDSESPALKEALSTIANKNHGTLFITAKTDSTKEGHNLLRLGGIGVYTESTSLGGSSFEQNTFNQNGAILKLTYQINPRVHKQFGSAIHISEGLHIAEIIYYDVSLTPEEARVVESYLALKYSINISENENPELRNYVNTSLKEVWQFGSDKWFNQEIMALGRMDKIRFYQPQTFTSDAQSIEVSLDATSTLGTMPSKHSLQDSSLLVISKNNELPTSGPCGSLFAERSWMFRFINWHSSATAFYITLKGDIDTGLVPTLTNGQFKKLLNSSYTSEKMVVEVPIIEGILDHNFYIIWAQKSQACKPFASVKRSFCDSLFGNLIHIQVEPTALPLDVELFHKNSGTYKALSMTTSDLFIEHLPQGEYDILVSNKDFQIADEVVLFKDCQVYTAASNYSAEPSISNHPNTTQGEASRSNESALLNSQNTFSRYGGFEGRESGLFNQVRIAEFNTNKSIECYPNPTKTGEQIDFKFIGFDEKEIQMKILDGKGKILFQNEHDLKLNESFHYRFKVSGSYLVQFTTGSFSETKHIIIH